MVALYSNAFYVLPGCQRLHNETFFKDAIIHRSTSQLIIPPLKATKREEYLEKASLLVSKAS